MRVERTDWGWRVTDDKTGKWYSILNHGAVYVDSALMLHRRKLVKLPAAAQKALDTHRGAQPAEYSDIVSDGGMDPRNA